MRLSGNVVACGHSNARDYAVKRYAIKWVDLCLAEYYQQNAGISLFK